MVEFGFRLPSAVDNRPLKFDEFQKFVQQAIYVSATPADYELERTQGVVVEQIIRPTGPVGSRDRGASRRAPGRRAPRGDPASESIGARRVLVTTLTKRMAEDLTEYYQDLGIRVRYLHSDIDTIERADILRDLRQGAFDVLVGINLLREGLDLPEVSLVAILDADKEGFLRAERSLIQTIGRAARNERGKVIMFADTVTASMRAALEETERRRQKQVAYNEAHGITPKTVTKRIRDLREIAGFKSDSPADAAKPLEVDGQQVADKDIPKVVEGLRKQMMEAAKGLDFETAAELRDQIRSIEAAHLGIGEPPKPRPTASKAKRSRGRARSGGQRRRRP